MKEKYIAFELDLHHSEYGKYVLSNYDVLEEIYRSENSQLYKIENLKTNVLSVLKVIKKKSFLQYDIEEFKKLRHENIVKIEDVGESEHFYYMIMEYIEGYTLERNVELFGPCSIEYVNDYVKQMVNALDYLHHHQDGNLIYRDLKPSNIMLSSSGKITLIDINTIRLKKECSHSDTYYIGSRGYTAPEAYGYSQSNEVSDIYSLGATLYFLLTSNVPSVGNNFSEEVKKSKIDKKYKSIIAKATKYNPKDRFQTIDKFKQACNRNVVLEKSVVMLSLLSILTITVGFGLNMYTNLNADPIHPLEVALVKTPNINTDFITDYELKSTVLVADKDILESTVESTVESTAESTSESMTETKKESLVELTTELTTEFTTELTTEESLVHMEEPVFITAVEQINNNEKTELFSMEDIENMKPAGKGLVIRKIPGLINVTFNKSNMLESLNNFYYLSVIRSKVMLDTKDLYHFAYEAAVLERGFQAYSDDGFNEVIFAGEYFGVMIYDKTKKPIGYYFSKEPYEP